MTSPDYSVCSISATRLEAAHCGLSNAEIADKIGAF